MKCHKKRKKKEKFKLFKNNLVFCFSFLGGLLLGKGVLRQHKVLLKSIFLFAVGRAAAPESSAYIRIQFGLIFNQNLKFGVILAPGRSNQINFDPEKSKSRFETGVSTPASQP